MGKRKQRKIVDRQIRDLGDLLAKAVKGAEENPIPEDLVESGIYLGDMGALMLISRILKGNQWWVEDESPVGETFGKIAAVLEKHKAYKDKQDDEPMTSERFRQDMLVDRHALAQIAQIWAATTQQGQGG